MISMKQMFKKYFVPHEHNDYKPHFWRGKSVFVVSLIIVSLFGLSLLQHAIIVRTNLASIISAVLVDLANNDREDINIKTLTVNPLLTLAAQKKADDMAKKGYFSHTSPDGLTPWHWFQEAGYVFKYAGENLAINFSDSGNVEKAWMNSLKHRENILNANFTEIGIAMAKGVYQGRETIFVVQMFGAPVFVKTGTVAPPVAIVVSPPVPPKEINNLFIAVKGETQEQPAPEEKTITPRKVSYATFSEELAVSPEKTLSYLYTVLGAFLLAAFVIFIAVESRKQSIRHILYALFVFCLMAGLVYINKAVFFTDVFIK